MTPDPAEIRRLHMRLVRDFNEVPEGNPRIMASRILSFMGKAVNALRDGNAALAACHLEHANALAKAYKRVTQ